jgi:hypothetical protein
MGTATLTTAVMDITLPEMYQDLPYENNDYWSCPDCKNTEYYENWNTSGYYDIDNLIYHLQKMEPDAIRLGEELSEDGALYTVLRQNVQEHSKYKCDYCGKLWDEEQLIKLLKWDCANCGEVWDECHDALCCCYGVCQHDQCTHRDGIKVEADEKGAYHPLRGHRMGVSYFFKCYCRRDEEHCGKFVCVICHEFVDTEANIPVHRCEGLRSPTPVIGDGVYRGTVECFCEAGFCCELHDIHREGHMLCWRS